MIAPNDQLRYYASHGPISDPGEYAALFAGLPRDISALCRIVQGCLLHIFWAERYGVRLSTDRQQEVELRRVANMLGRLQELDSSPLDVKRPPERRLIGNCRDFSVLLCSMLRHQGVPARARCGFAKYFRPQHFEDHWVCEYWKADEQRWVMVDAQLDELQREALRIGFDPEDVPPDQFLPGGTAWRLCRSGQADPDIFGIFDMRGLWLIRGDLVRDIASLNKMELLPWDCWGIMDIDEKMHSADDVALLDRVAQLAPAGEVAFSELRVLYDSDARLRVPRLIRSYGRTGVKEVDLDV